MRNELNWIQDLPGGWESMPLKAIANYSVSNVDKISKKDEILVELCNYTDVYNNDFITSDLEFMLASATEEEIRKFQLNIGDVLITKDSESWDDIGIPALVIETKEKLLCGYHLAIIKANQTKIIPEYLFRCIEAKIIRIQLELASTGVTRFGLPKDEIGRLKLPIPNLSIQEKIISFLKTELLFIDRLIAQKEQLIHLLSEKRQALITQAVTRGLDPNVKLKSSGVDWLGDVPEHWDVIQMKYLASEPLMYGANEAALDDNPNNPRFIRITDINNDGSLRDDTFKSLEMDIAKDYLLDDGDLLFARSGATVGKAFLYKKEWGICCFAGYLIRMRSNRKRILPEFLILITESSYYWNQIYTELIQATIQNFSGEKYSSMKIILPDMNEQNAIVTFLKIELNKIDELSKLTEKTILLLKERRTALISAAVTGQIEIPEIS